MRLKLNHQSRSLFFLTVKLVVVGGIGYLLFRKLENQQNLLVEIREEMGQSLLKDYMMYGLVFLLMLLNWSLEALKWQLVAAKVAALSFWQSFEGVLSGLTLSFITPHGIGDYFGRILTVQASAREKLVGSVFLSRMSQMIATFLFGLVGISYLYRWKWIVSAFFVFVVLTVILGWLLKLSIKSPFVQKYIDIVFQFKFREIAMLQTLAIVRYVVFASQFLIILYLYIPDLSLSLGFGGVTYIFLAKSVLPTFNFLSDLGVREYSAISFFEEFNVALLPVLSASLSIWIVNILVPTLMGIPLMLKLKWQRS